MNNFNFGLLFTVYLYITFAMVGNCLLVWLIQYYCYKYFCSSRILLAGANEKMAPSFTRTVHVDSMSPRAAVLVEVFIFYFFIENIRIFQNDFSLQ